MQQKPGYYIAKAYGKILEAAKFIKAVKVLLDVVKNLLDLI